MALGKQNLKDSKKITEYSFKYKYPSWQESVLGPVAVLIIGLILFLLPIVLAILSGKIWKVFELDWGEITTLISGPLFSILFFIIAAFTWPYIPCTIRIFSDSIMFNQKSRTRLYNPKRQLFFNEIKSCKYLPEKKELTIITKTKQRRSINLVGANNNDVENFIKTLKNKGIKITNKKTIYG